MDQIKIGEFIAKLRKEKGYTQERLGEILGVTNKTVSRWERGNYMPDIEMLSLLSKEFEVSINELVAGERLNDDDFKKVAETNLVSALENSTFTCKEKVLYFKKKWRKEHVWSIIISAIVWICIIIALKFQDVETALCGAIGGILASLFYIVLYNRMMAYVEKHVYKLPPETKEKE